MRAKLAKKPEIADIIVPKNFAVGCRRPTPGNGYLEALCEDNVTVVSKGITEITPKGMKTADGVEHEFDVIVCATGFDVSWRPHYPTIGRNGVSLSKYWQDVPNTYLSLGVANMPNYFSKSSRRELGSRNLTWSQFSTVHSVPTATEASSPSQRQCHVT
jgi:cation diffusion facilitator CzcD-associated flavoprotein CzcO